MINKIRLLSPVVVAFIFLAAVLVSLQFGARPTYAQTPADIQVVKRLNRPSPVVRVGEFISFTVFITNQSAFTLVHATLFDNFREDILGNFSMLGGDPAPTIIEPANGTLTWTNLISNPAAPGYFPELPPGQGISLTMQFQVQHPPAGGFTIVNRAQIRDAVFFGGGGGDGDVITSPTVPITGGMVTVAKDLNPPDQMPGLGDRLTYTIQLTNEGAAAITQAVVVDTYNPAFLAFITSTPTAPTAIDAASGVITWTNLATPPIQPGQVISLPVIFEVLQAGIEVMNRVDLISAQDFFGNDMAPGSGEAGILIIPDSNDDNTGDENNDDDDDDESTPTPIPTPTPSPTPVATATPVATVAAPQGVISGPNTPIYLPETGRLDPPQHRLAVPIFSLILLTAAWYFFRMRENRK